MTAHSAAPTPAGQTGLLLDGDELEKHLRAVLDQQGSPPANHLRSLPRRVPAVSSGAVAGKPPLPGHGRSPIGSTDDLYKLCDPPVNIVGFVTVDRRGLSHGCKDLSSRDKVPVAAALPPPGSSQCPRI